MIRRSAEAIALLSVRLWAAPAAAPDEAASFSCKQP